MIALMTDFGLAGPYVGLTLSHGTSPLGDGGVVYDDPDQTSETATAFAGYRDEISGGWSYNVGGWASEAFNDSETHTPWAVNATIMWEGD